MMMCRPSRKRRRLTEDGTLKPAKGTQDLAEKQATSPEQARLVSDGSGYRYVNNHLWTAISRSAESGERRPELARTPDGGITGDSIYETSVSLGAEIAGQGSLQDAGSTSAGRHFIFNHPQRDRFQAVMPVQPPANHIIQLWQTYLTNVDPIMKVFHTQTMQQTVLGQIGKASLPVNLQALTSAIYFISAVSLQNDECEALLQLPRSDLIRKYRANTEDALSAAGFVTTTDIHVLQALLLYLAALRSLGETSTVWSMNGLAIRIAGTIGLARDGSVLNLPPFDCEVRRRLWWALTYLDARTAELVGQDGDLLVQKHDVGLPANLNDAQLFPTMQRLPDAKPGATEITYVLLRAILSVCLNDMPGNTGPAGTWRKMRAESVPIDEKADIVEMLEKRFDNDILRFCDATVPLQALTMNAAQTFLTKMRLVGNIPYDRSAETAGSSEGFSENLFQLAMKMMQLQLELFNDPSLQRWRWHWQSHFQWYALAELIRQTRLRRNGPMTMKAWSLIQKIFDYVVPTLELAPQKSPLLEAIQSLLHAAKSSQEQSKEANNGNQAASLSGEQAKTASLAANEQHSVEQPLTPSSTGHGSRPFNALLPGMNYEAPAEVRRTDNGGTGDLDDFAGGFDMAAIDWAEFDRLATELCGQ
jgi:hypothetical protein